MRIVVLALAGVVAAAPPAGAQLLDQLKGVVGGGQGGSGGLPGGLPSVGSASSGNTAGVLQYCVKNNYLSAGSASPVQSALMSKVRGQGTGDPGYRAGSDGLLETGNGQSYSLGNSTVSGGLKEQATHKVCDMVLQHAKSLL
jgi:hypothetical protein